MIYARQGANVVTATPGAKGVCPSCGDGVVAKCGRVVVWHWAHRVADCDPWVEPMSKWHLRWQSFASPGAREVVMERDGEKHRADVVARNGSVLELQSSHISAEEIARRESFYGRMAWMYRADWLDRVHFGKRGFWWKQGSITQTKITKPLFWDVDGEVWHVSLSEVEGPDRECGGHYDDEIGRWVSHYATSRRVVGKILKSWSTNDFAMTVFGRSEAA